jgi:putative polyhydroxyalkanoate system protein
MAHEAAQEAADSLAQDLAERFDIDYGWDGDSIVFERPGVHGEILVRESEIHVKARLGMFLSFLKPRIEEEVVRYLRDHFGCRFDT